MTFSFTLRAPDGFAGGVTTDWQMVHEGVAWFGDVTSAAVTVACEDDPRSPRGRRRRRR